MTPPLLRRIQELVEAGATVLGTRPLKSPSLVNFPACDQELTHLADELWGENAGADGSGERRVGKGRVIWGSTPEKILAGMSVPPDFSCDPALKGKLLYTHRHMDDGLELYLVANKVDGVVQGACTFRAATGQPELWWPQTGRTEPLAEYERTRDVTRVPIRLERQESVFVVFRPGREAFDPVVSVTREGQSIVPSAPVLAKIAVQKAVYGLPGDPKKTRDVTAKVQAIVDGGERRFPACRLGEGDSPALTKLNTLDVDYTLDASPRKTVALDGETLCLDDAADPEPLARVSRTADGKLLLEAWRNGRYELKTASGRTLQGAADGIPAARQIAGPWELRFPIQAGVPEKVALDALISWSRHSDPGVRYFSGTATYRKSFCVAAEELTAGRAVYLDLGKVAVIAQVRLNGNNLGILWKAPFRVEATSALRAGDNLLEVQVTNLWVNRMIGDEQLPADAEYKPSGILKAWPQWLLDGKPSPTGRHTFATYRIWKKDSPLQESGLLGPVTLYATQRIAPR
jgi:hypothetical protein